MKFQKSRRPQSESPRRRSNTPKHQKRNIHGRFTPNHETEIEITETNQPGPGASTPMRDTHDLFVPNLFVNSTEEGEIDNSLEIDNGEGSKNLEIKTEETESDNTEQINTTEKNTERRSDRNRRRPNYYGTVRYC